MAEQRQLETATTKNNIDQLMSINEAQAREISRLQSRILEVTGETERLHAQLQALRAEMEDLSARNARMRYLLEVNTAGQRGAGGGNDG